MNISKDERSIIKNQIQVEIFKRSFYEFFQWAVKLLEPNTKWKFNWHHEYLANILQEETYRIKEGRKKDKNYVINVPFRSSKSLMVSICYPIWSWMVDPSLSFINLSYSADLSTDHSNKVVAILNHPKFRELFADWDFDPNQRGKTDFKLNHGGSRLSGGVTGTVLGRGGDVIIIDDPNNTKRLSSVERHNTIKSWTDTINTRLNDPEVGLFIIIQQRLHQQDLSGYLLSKEPDNWKHICLPAELSPNVEPKELAENYIDGLLWGNRFNRNVLRNFKNTLGSVQYSNQLQQSPTPDEGNIIKREWINKIPYEAFKLMHDNGINSLTGKPMPKDTIVWDIFLDSAYTKKQENDPSALVIACKYNNDVYIRKAFEFWLEFPDLIKKIKEIHGLYCTNKSTINIEPKASGLDVINTLRKETSFNVVEIKDVKGDKETRLNSVSPYIEGSRLILIEDVSNDLVIDQLCGFPNVEHDDVMDCTVYSLLKYIGKAQEEFNYLLL